MFLLLGDFPVWSFLLYMLFKVSMSSHKWAHFYLADFFSLHPSRISNPPMTNHLYTLSLLFAVLLFFFPMRQGRQCAVLDISTVHLGYTETIWLHLMSFLECIFFLVAMSRTGIWLDFATFLKHCVTKCFQNIWCYCCSVQQPAESVRYELDYLTPKYWLVWDVR